MAPLCVWLHSESALKLSSSTASVSYEIAFELQKFSSVERSLITSGVMFALFMIIVVPPPDELPPPSFPLSGITVGVGVATVFGPVDT